MDREYHIFSANVKFPDFTPITDAYMCKIIVLTNNKPVFTSYFNNFLFKLGEENRNSKSGKTRMFTQVFQIIIILNKEENLAKTLMI